MNPVVRFLVLCGFLLALLAPAAQAGTSKTAVSKSAKKTQVVKASARKPQVAKASSRKPQLAKRSTSKRAISVAAKRKQVAVARPVVPAKLS
ncbi:MAG: hypothetical protein KDH91_02210, partial [Rhodoferax sp.]|nr:hypothetical protein [Rhodoferax sp.]